MGNSNSYIFVTFLTSGLSKRPSVTMGALTIGLDYVYIFPSKYRLQPTYST